MLDARYSYLSLVIKNRSTAAVPLPQHSQLTPPLSLPITDSTQPTTGKASPLPSVVASNSSHQHTKSIDSLVTSSSPPPPPHQKKLTSATPHKKTFNAFLEDTNEEWNDSIEDNKPRDETLDATYTTAHTSAAAHTTSSLVPELEEDRIITKLTLTDRPPSPQPTTTTAPLISSDVNGVIGNVMDVLKGKERSRCGDDDCLKKKPFDRSNLHSASSET